MTSPVNRGVFRVVESVTPGEAKENKTQAAIRFFSGILNTLVKSAHTLTLVAGGKIGSLASKPSFNVKDVTVRGHSRNTDPGRAKKTAATDNASSVRRRFTDTLARTLRFAGPAKAAVKSTSPASTIAAESVPLTAAQKILVTENLKVFMGSMLNQMKAENDIEGVFRVGDVGSRIVQAMENLKSQAMTADTLTVYSLKLSANVLKRMMAELASPPDGKPLFDKELLDAIAQPQADASSILKEAIDRLDDDYRKNNLNSIIDFLARLREEIPDFVDRSLMSNDNLAVVTAVKLLPDDLLPADFKENMANTQKITQAFEKVLNTWAVSTATVTAAEAG